MHSYLNTFMTLAMLKIEPSVVQIVLNDRKLRHPTSTFDSAFWELMFNNFPVIYGGQSTSMVGNHSSRGFNGVCLDTVIDSVSSGSSLLVTKAGSVFASGNLREHGGRLCEL